MVVQIMAVENANTEFQAAIKLSYHKTQNIPDDAIIPSYIRVCDGTGSETHKAVLIAPAKTSSLKAAAIIPNVTTTGVPNSFPSTFYKCGGSRTL